MEYDKSLVEKTLKELSELVDALCIIEKGWSNEEEHNRHFDALTLIRDRARQIQREEKEAKKSASRQSKIKFYEHVPVWTRKTGRIFSPGSVTTKKPKDVENWRECFLVWDEENLWKNCGVNF